MAKDKIVRDKAAEKAVKARLQRTHLKQVKIVGSEANKDSVSVFILRTLGVNNYLFKVNCIKNGSSYEMSGLFPVNDAENYGEYRFYNPQYASAEVLKPTDKEKKFTGYGK
ncbi:MAG: hypothetical protein PHS19_01610 [Eubacteriales bacterium]|nr:hypothetical protein [Eubacteriales bacterium]